MSTPRSGWTVGPTLELSGRRQRSAADRFGQLIDGALMRREHLWIATLGYLVTMPLRPGALLDPDNVIGPPVIGCFVCEQDYTEGMVGTPCPGDPGGSL
jgi:hypothetical protein